MTSPLAYLSVDRYLQTQLDARALAFAISSGLIDKLQRGPCALDEVPVSTSFGKRLLLHLLEDNRVISCREGVVSIDPAFRETLAYRDLLQCKIEFADYVVGDIAEHFAALIDELPAFMAKSRTFALFRYDRCFTATQENVAATKRWMGFTTSLTRYEGGVLASLLDLSSAGRLLDVGGNSGELAIQLCDHNPKLHVLVADLPVVCQVGRAHVVGRASAPRVAFQSCDMRHEALPAPFDVVVFKSVLHDWPDEDARALVARGYRACRPGGRLVIFERGPMTLEGEIPYAQLPNLVFAPFYRDSSLYEHAMREWGCDEVDVRTVRLEMDFHLIVARRPMC